MFSLDSKRVTVMGLGGFGGGVGVTRWLATQGAHVLVTDPKPMDKLAASVDALQDLIAAGRVTVRPGEHRREDFTNTDLVVVNPAVPAPWKNPLLQAAADARVPLTTEIGLSVARLPNVNRMIAITGSVGKSTTSAMIHHLLTGLGHHAEFGGNIGGSLLTRDIHPSTWIVLELSSFMLHWLGQEGGPGFAPRVAVVTNLSPNHLDWHGTLDHYRSSKQQILARQRPGSAAILGGDPTIGVADWPTRPGVTRVVIPPDAAVKGLAVPGRHNAWNAAVAVAAVQHALSDMESDALLRASTFPSLLSTFPGLAHRLRRVGTFAGVTCFNDSKSTTPESTLLALDALAEHFGLARVHLIAGGYDKGSDLAPVAAHAPRLGGLYTVGQTGPALDATSMGHSIPCGTVERAVAAAFDRTKPGDALLLSPACASWGQFENFERRGELFERLVQAHAEEHPR
jgi:UDP-N-acetylmuramoylalanine--D-glutamate ligase